MGPNSASWRRYVKLEHIPPYLNVPYSWHVMFLRDAFADPNNYHSRSLSPTARDSERSSASTSRRSSPHIHPSRMALAPVLSRESRARSPPPRSPPTHLAHRERNPARPTPKERSPIRQIQPRSPPRGPAAFRAPSGPSSSRNFSAPTRSPSVSSSVAPPSMPAHNRPDKSATVVPPAGPRGYVPPSRGQYVGRGGRGSFSSERQSRPDWGGAPSSRASVDTSSKVSQPARVAAPAPSPAVPSTSSSSSSIPTGPSTSIPTGPRAGPSIPSRPSISHAPSSYSARTQSVSGSSGPRPHPAMAGLPQIIPGGT